jgi:hypothetical protein
MILEAYNSEDNTYDTVGMFTLSECRNIIEIRRENLRIDTGDESLDN